jgi:hypothetical protein
MKVSKSAFPYHTPKERTQEHFGKILNTKYEYQSCDIIKRNFTYFSIHLHLTIDAPIVTLKGKYPNASSQLTSSFFFCQIKISIHYSNHHSYKV